MKYSLPKCDPFKITFSGFAQGSALLQAFQAACKLNYKVSSRFIDGCADHQACTVKGDCPLATVGAKSMAKRSIDT